MELWKKVAKKFGRLTDAMAFLSKAEEEREKIKCKDEGKKEVSKNDDDSKKVEGKQKEKKKEDNGLKKTVEGEQKEKKEEDDDVICVGVSTTKGNSK